MSRTLDLARTAKTPAVTLIALALGATVLTGCSKSSPATATATEAATTSVVKAASGGAIASKYKNKTIGVVHLTKADENETTLVKALKEASTAGGLGWKFVESDGQGDQGKIQQAMSAFIAQKVDAIVLEVVSTRLVSKELADAKAAGIPVFGEWTFSELDPNLTADYTPVPAADASALAGQMFSELYLAHPAGDIQVALVNTDLDILQARNAVVRGLAKLYPRIKIVDSANISFTDIVGSSTQIANGFLSKYPDLDAIWTAYPLSGPAAAQAILAAHKNVKVYTHVAQSEGIKALADPANPLSAMPWLDFDWESYHLVDTMLSHFGGKPVNKLNGFQDVVPFKVFTKANAKEGLTGKGVAAGIGWTLLEGSWKQPLVDTWKTKFAS
jgi:ABC-type sugar transport system substrate-binding protein